MQEKNRREDKGDERKNICIVLEEARRQRNGRTKLGELKGNSYGDRSEPLNSSVQETCTVKLPVSGFNETMGYANLVGTTGSSILLLAAGLLTKRGFSEWMSNELRQAAAVAAEAEVEGVVEGWAKSQRQVSLAAAKPLFQD